MNETNRRKTHRIHYEWQINHYSYYDAKRKDVNSPIFAAETNNEYRWHLKITFKRADFLGLFLVSDKIDQTKTIFAKLRFAILNDQQEMINICHSPQIREFKIYNNSWGYKKFINRTMIFNTGLLTNDKLTIYCAVIFCEENNFTDEFYLPISNQLRNQLKECTLSKNVGALLLNLDFADVTLTVKGMRNFYAHKCILAARSPVFYAMFNHNMLESINSHVQISDVDDDVFEQLLKYIYTDNCDITQELAEGLFVAAEKYDLKGLKFSCEKVLFEKLSIENATEILTLAYMHGASELKSKTIEFIITNNNKLKSFAPWYNMAIYHPLLLNEVVMAYCNRYYSHLIPFVLRMRQLNSMPTGNLS